MVWEEGGSKILNGSGDDGDDNVLRSHSSTTSQRVSQGCWSGCCETEIEETTPGLLRITEKQVTLLLLEEVPFLREDT